MDEPWNSGVVFVPRLVIILGSYLPARRVVAIDPQVLLREM